MLYYAKKPDLFYLLCGKKSINYCNLMFYYDANKIYNIGISNIFNNKKDFYIMLKKNSFCLSSYKKCNKNKYYTQLKHYIKLNNIIRILAKL